MRRSPVRGNPHVHDRIGVHCGAPEGTITFETLLRCAASCDEHGGGFPQQSVPCRSGVEPVQVALLVTPGEGDERIRNPDPPADERKVGA